jgi:hypothetical protein
MKNTIKYTLIALAAIVLASCSDFLEKKPYDSVDPETTVTDEVAVALSNACYRTLMSSNMYNMRMWTLDILAGNSNVGAGGGTDGLETIQAADFITQSDNGMALYMWRSPWVGIAQCNILLNSIADADISEDIKAQCLGEAHFLRAHYYYILVRLYGSVPIRKEPYDPSTSAHIARATLEDNYKLIISDCEKAIELLPAKGEYDALNVGRACKEAAMCQLADVYLTLAPKNTSLYQEVVDLCDEIASYGWDLATCDFAKNFDATINNGPESLFEIQYSGSTEYDFWGNNAQCSWVSTFMGPRNSDFVAGSYGWNQPTEEFMSQWEEGDLRKDLTVFYEGCPDWEGKPYKKTYSNTGYNVRKFLVSKSVSPEYNTNPANWIVYRYADVLLKKAEALNEMGQTTEAETPLNIVRKRAGLADVKGLSQDAMREKIIHERRMELAFEGHRWFDMIRVQGGEYAVNFLHSIGKTNANLNRLIFPIPQTERDANPLIDQNPGY